MAELNLKPLADRVIIAPLEDDEVTASGIILPETAKEKPQKGTILAVGPGAKDDAGKHIPMSVKEGDVVLYGKYAGTEVKMPSGKSVLVVRENDIFAIIQ
jgi:chaperonin GroES